MAKPLLSYRALHGALVARLINGDTLSIGRDKYVGGSEIGGCPRLVSYRKALGIPFRPDPEGAGVMLPGKLSENEMIQLLRLIGLDRALSSTGRSQADLRDEEFPLGSHPDGLVAEDAFDLDPLSTYFQPNGRAWDLAALAPLLVGPGIVEVKSGSSSVFKAAIRRGLSETYQDQTQAEMGLSERRWTLVVFVCRDNLSKLAMFFVPFDDARFQTLRRRSAAIMATAAQARRALEEALPEEQDWPSRGEDEDAIRICSPLLMDPDEERGYCSKCPLRHSCPALVKTEKDSLFPVAVLDEVAALAESYDEAAAREKAAKEEKEEARDRLVGLREQYGANKASLSGPVLSSVSIGSNKGRLSCDFEHLRTNFPEAYSVCVSEGDPFYTVRVTRKKGARA